MATIGIMQGRLCPPIDGRFQCFPRENWVDEFARAAEAGLDAIEWIYDAHGADVNPLATDRGLESIRSLAAGHGVAIQSLCADYFLDRPLLRTEAHERAELLSTLSWLIGRCRALGVLHIVLPFVDASRIETDAEADEMVAMLGPALGVAHEVGVELHLETSLAPGPFAALLGRLPHPSLKANYDSGNSASLGHDPRDEFNAYGRRVGSIHIKDRIRGGGTVPLGSGDANFPALFDCVARVGYGGGYTLQVARGEPGDEVAWAVKNRAWLVDRIDRVGPALKEDGR